MSLVSNLKTRIIVLINILFFFTATISQADPVVAGEIIPPASATMITDIDLIRSIGVGPDDDPVWCYSNDANAIIITAPEREREKCELKLSYESEKLKAIHKLQLDTLKVELESTIKKHDQLMLSKDKEIEELTEAALDRPNDYSAWWATGGFVVGVSLSVLAFLVVKQ